MRILHIVPNLNEEASGPSYSVPSLCSYIQQSSNVDISIACISSSKCFPYLKYHIFNDCKLLSKYSISFKFLYFYIKHRNDYDIIHVHSLWSFVNFVPGILKLNKNVKLIVSPRGTLSQWSLNHSKIKKTLFGPLQFLLLKNADAFHVTSSLEFDEVRSCGCKQPIFIIPNGVNITNKKTTKTKTVRTCLFLSRIHPKKGLELLLQAWYEVSSRKDFCWELIIAGKGDKRYEHKIRNIVDNTPFARFIGPIYSEKKSELFSNSDLFVLPTYSENFGLVIAEALSFSIPVIVSDQSPWNQINDLGCGWCIPNNFDVLKSTLIHALSLSDLQRQKMGSIGFSYIKNTFDWSIIAEKTIKSYLKLKD